MATDETASGLKIFIDIDGTILYEPTGGNGSIELDHQLVCSGISEFLDFVVAQCDPYWLTYRARLGNREMLEREILPHLPERASAIPVAYWDEHKHEALSASTPFLWFDDNPESEDLDWLASHQIADQLVLIDRTRPDNPDRMLAAVRSKLGLR